MSTVSLAEFFERLIAIELGSAEMFSRLAARLKRLPEVASRVRGFEEDERANLGLLERFRDSLPPVVLAGSCDAAVLRQLERAAGLLEGDPAARFLDFEEAYQFIHELENNEVVPLLRLLEGECRTERLDCSAIMLIVEQRLSRLDGLVKAAGDRELRRAMRL
jgi:hypothetical protein